MSQKSWDWDNKMLERFYIIQYHQKNQRMWRNLCVHGTILDSLWPLGPQATQALNTGICHGNQCMGAGTLPENTICEHSSPLIQVVSYKEEAICMHLSFKSL